MSEIKLDFIYEGNTISIYCKEDDLTKEAISKFCTKAEINNNSIYCIYSGNPLDENKKISEIKSKNKEDQEKVESIVKPSQAICPECGEIALITFQNYKIKTSCKNGHEKNNIFLDEFEKTQKIDESKINCDICKDLNKSMTFKKEFYFCGTCKKNICPLCKAKHSKTHNNIVKYEQKNFICFEHEDNFGLYCKDCKLNLCSACENEHSEHETVTFGKLFPNKKDLEKKMKELKDNIDTLKAHIKNIIEILNKVNENMERYYEIINYLINSFSVKAKNYELLKNIKDINISHIINDISDIIKEEKLDKKFNLIYDIYSKMTSNDNTSEKQNSNLSDSESPKQNNDNFSNNNIFDNENNSAHNSTGMGGINIGMSPMNTGIGGINMGISPMDMNLMGMLGMNPGMNMGMGGMNMGMGGMNMGMGGMNMGMSGMNMGKSGMNMNPNINMNNQTYDKNIIKITFQATSGLKTDIYVNKNSTFHELFEIYLKKIQKPNIHDKIIFLHDAQKFNYENEEKISKLINLKRPHFTVLDQENLIS